MKDRSYGKYSSLAVGKSRQGLGIFAKKNFLPSERIFEVKGAFISGDEDDQIDEKTRSNAFRFDRETYISPQGEIGDFLNHSCSPNAVVRKIGTKLFVTAVDRIVKGKEIFIDYSTILAKDDSWEMRCNCGSKICRRVIKKFDSLPKPTREAYLTRGMAPDYILAI